MSQVRARPREDDFKTILSDAYARTKAEDETKEREEALRRHLEQLYTRIATEKQLQQQQQQKRPAMPAPSEEDLVAAQVEKYYRELHQRMAAEKKSRLPTVYESEVEDRDQEQDEQEEEDEDERYHARKGDGDAEEQQEQVAVHEVDDEDQDEPLGEDDDMSKETAIAILQALATVPSPDSIISKWLIRKLSPSTGKLMTRSPDVEILDRDSHYQIYVDVPGCRDIDVSIAGMGPAAGQSLVVTGKRHHRHGRVITSEMSYGRFLRIIRLPSDVSIPVEQDLDWKVKSGVISVKLDKRKTG